MQQQATRQIQVLFSVTLALWLFVSPTVANPTAAGTPPPPLPEDEWVGKTKWNFTEAHEKYGDVITCIYIPVGVYGAYAAISTMLIYIFTIGSSLWDEDEEKTRSWSSFLLGLLSVAHSTYQIFQNISTVQSCQGVQGLKLVLPSVVFNLIAAILAAVGSFAGAIASLRGHTTGIFRGIAACTIGLALIFQFISSIIYYLIVKASTLGWLEGLKDDGMDRVAVSATVVSVLPAIIFPVVAVVGGLYCKQGETYELYAKNVFGFFCILAAFSVFPGLTNVSLGKILGDPWGSYALKETWLGITNGVFTCGIAVLEFILLLVPWLQM